MKLGKSLNPYRFSNASLTIRFALNSFICISIMTVALWVIVSNYLVHEMLEREWTATADLVRADIKEYLTTTDFTTKDRKSVGPKFETLLKHVSLMPEIVRFKVYNPNGVIIWSDDKRLVGKSFPDNRELQEALRGKIVADLSSANKPENVLEQGSLVGTVEVYFPVYSDNGKELLGVFETYKRADGIYRNIRKARLVILLAALGGGLLLYFSLFAIVRQAAKKIDEQQTNLLKVQSQLVASQRMAAVGEMAAAVAHGIGNPLSSIRAAAQVAILDADSENGSEEKSKMKANLESIIEQVDRVQKRMQGLLNFAKPMEPHPVPVEVNSLLDEVVNTLRPRFAEALVQPGLELGANIPKVSLDATQAEQIFMGLISNAVEATPKGGTVTIRTQADSSNGQPPSVIVSVEDTGPGIPVENRQKVFEPFFTTKLHGTGIGLPLAKKFVERNGGTIQISESRTGGAKFDVTFPWQPMN